MSKKTASSRSHQCPSHHVELIECPKAHQTAEQLWCGKWFECPHPRCGFSSLQQSPELAAFLAKQMESLKAQYLALKGKR